MTLAAIVYEPAATKVFVDKTAGLLLDRACVVVHDPLPKLVPAVPPVDSSSVPSGMMTVAGGPVLKVMVTTWLLTRISGVSVAAGAVLKSMPVMTVEMSSDVCEAGAVKPRAQVSVSVATGALPVPGHRRRGRGGGERGGGGVLGGGGE